MVIKKTYSIEEKVEDLFKKQLDSLQIRYFTKTESINSAISTALADAESKSGGVGGNRPDIQLFLETKKLRRIPVMIEVKGTRNKLVKFLKIPLLFQRILILRFLLIQGTQLMVPYITLRLFSQKGAIRNVLR